MAEGQQQICQIQLEAGQFVKLIVEQEGIDVAVQLSGPDGNQLMEFNSEIRPRGHETVSWVAAVAGRYRLNVQSRSKAAGSYEIRIAEARPATDDDRALQEARQLYPKHVKLFNAGKYDEAISSIERVLEIRQKVLGAEHPDLAGPIHNLGVLYWLKGDYAQAEPLLQRALSLREKTLEPEHPDLARSLNQIAILYWD
ncbi:MAG TPA: tetratricopeptide repeat protein, partial [Blastocatellia bacterium]|nr:tetratricopeptide repeat protein [Blastocatellia bacterium]